MSEKKAEEKSEVQKVAEKLVALCREGKYLDAIDAFYGKNIVSVEPIAMETMPAKITGFDDVRNKSVWWIENHTWNSGSVEGPFVHGERFAVYFTMNITEKKTGKTMDMSEMALYTVKDGKIVHEEFFYGV